MINLVDKYGYDIDEGLIPREFESAINLSIYKTISVLFSPPFGTGKLPLMASSEKTSRYR